MKPLVIDTGVLALYFNDDPRVAEYFSLFLADKATAYATGITLTELYYKTCQKIGKQTADKRFFQLKASPLRVVTDDDLARTAGLERCRQRSVLSTADCYALALTKRLNGLLLTTDEALSKAEGIESRYFSV